MEISKTVNAVENGEKIGEENRQLSNLFEIIEDGLKNDV